MTLSKSKILSSRQCAKKLWLEIHHKELAVVSGASLKNFSVGNQVGEISHKIYDPEGKGQLIDPFTSGFPVAFKQTQELLESNSPIFEAAFSIEGVLVLADVLLPGESGQAWRMIEIKSSTSVKDYHLDDVAIQSYVAKSSGLELESIAVGHINNQWVYQGDDNYSGLITEVDLTAHAVQMEGAVEQWFKEAHSTANQKIEPDISIGSHCSKPFACPFIGYCSKDQPEAIYPVNWLPRIQKKVLKEYIQNNGIIEMSEVPDELLNEIQLRVKEHTLAETVYFDQEGASKVLSVYDYPHYFVDFETINLAIPKWKGTRAYQQIPFQFSLHYIEDAGEEVIHKEFLDISGDDPSIPFAEALIEKCGDRGPIFVYNVGFESTRVKELAERLPELSNELTAIRDRLVDLWPVAKKFYYHPSQQGSWSIKNVLPAISDEYSYDDLEGVSDGGMAMEAFDKAIDLNTSAKEKQVIESQLLKYCELDTLAMVEMFDFFLLGPLQPSGTIPEMVNKNRFTLEEVQSYFLEYAKDGADYRNGYVKSIVVAARVFTDDLERNLSIIKRVRGLSELVTQKKLPGWAIPKSGNEFDVHKNILAAMGCCDMVVRDSDLLFDVDSFLETALSQHR